MSDLTDRLRDIADQATPGPWKQDDREGLEYYVFAEVDPFPGGVDVAKCVWGLEDDAVYVSTFDPVLVGAMLDVIDAADRLAQKTAWPVGLDGLDYAVLSALDVALARFREVSS